MNQSKALWQDKLSRIELDIANTPPNVTEMFYSSFYRSFLTPVSRIDLRFLTEYLSDSLRIMPLEKDKAHSQILLSRTSILYTAGEI